MSRDTKRFVLSLLFVVLGAYLVIFCQDDLSNIRNSAPGIDIPGLWLGGFVAIDGLLGMFGVNVFIGGPFDKRADPAPSEEEE